MMAQMDPQEVKGESGKVLAGRKVLEVSLITTGMKCRGKMIKMSHIPPQGSFKIECYIALP